MNKEQTRIIAEHRSQHYARQAPVLTLPPEPLAMRWHLSAKEYLKYWVKARQEVLAAQITLQQAQAELERIEDMAPLDGTPEGDMLKELLPKPPPEYPNRSKSQRRSKA